MLSTAGAQNENFHATILCDEAGKVVLSPGFARVGAGRPCYANVFFESGGHVPDTTPLERGCRYRG